MVAPLTCGFIFHNFNYPWPTAVQKYSIADCRNKQCMSFALCAVLSSVMKSLIIRFCPAGVMSHPFVHCVPHGGHLVG